MKPVHKQTCTTRGLARATARFALGLFVAAAPLCAAGAPAGMLVAHANACLGCHTVDRKLVGPSFQQIAARYKGKPGAQAYLEHKVRTGGSGVWGVIPMPSHPGMKPADIKAVVAWALMGAPSK